MKSDPLYLNRNCSLCTDHFEDSEFMNAKTKSKLKWNAVPIDALFDTEHTTTSSSVKTVQRLVLNYFGIDLVRSVVHFSVSKIKLTTVIKFNIFSLFLETNRPYTRLHKCVGV